MTLQTSLKIAVRYGYFPFMAFGINGLAVAAIFSSLSATELAMQMTGLMALALLSSYASEHLLPYNQQWSHPRGDKQRDLIHFCVNESMSLLPLLIIPIFIISAPAPASPLWPQHWPLLLQLLLCLLIFDLGQNLFHWLAHVWKPLWRLHAVHHSVKRMYGLNGILKHPVYQLLSAVVATGPLVLLGMPKAFSLALAFMTFTQLLLQHSNTAYQLGALRKVFAVAEVHRFHHLRGVAGNVNFALFFSFFDHLLGNAYFSAKTLSSDDIGLDYQTYPDGWWAQMKAPFTTFVLLPRRENSTDADPVEQS